MLDIYYFNQGFYRPSQEFSLVMEYKNLYYCHRQHKLRMVVPSISWKQIHFHVGDQSKFVARRGGEGGGLGITWFSRRTEVGGGGGTIEFKEGSFRKLTADWLPMRGGGGGLRIKDKDFTELYHRETSKILQTPTPSRRNKATSPVRVEVIGILFWVVTEWRFRCCRALLIQSEPQYW